MQTSFMRTFLLSLLVAVLVHVVSGEYFLTFFFNLHPYHEYTVQHNGTLLKVMACHRMRCRNVLRPAS